MSSDSRKHILVVDDSADTQVLMKVILESNGYLVNCTSNGREALSALRLLDKLPDLIFLDMQMPVMDGRELQAYLKKDARLKSIPVVVMTGEDRSTKPKKEVSASAILTKPLNLKAIVSVAKRYSRLH
jgi:CheY-like chemotaxis protein